MQNLAFIIPPNATKFIPALCERMDHNLSLTERTCCFTREIDGVSVDIFYQRKGEYVDAQGRVCYHYTFYSGATADGRSITDVMLRMRVGYYASLSLPVDNGEYIRVRARFTMTLRSFIDYELQHNRRVRKVALKTRSAAVDRLLNEAIANPHLHVIDPRLIILYTGIDDINANVLRKHFDREVFGLNQRVVRRAKDNGKSTVDPYFDRERIHSSDYPMVASMVLTDFINPDLNVGRHLVVSCGVQDTLESRKSGFKFDDELLQINIVRLNQNYVVGNHGAPTQTRQSVSIRPTNVGDNKRHRLNILAPAPDGYINTFREGDYIAVLQNPVSADFIFISGAWDR